MKPLYFDYNATHPPIVEILERNLLAYAANPSNASGISGLSQKNQGRIEGARAKIATTLSSTSSNPIKPRSLHFVSTGTEGIYQMIRSFAVPGASVLLSPYEHDAMIAACEDANCQIEYLRAEPNGSVDPTDLAERLATGVDFAFVSVLAVSNETGVIQDSAELSRIARNAGIPYLSDCVQAAGKIQLDYSLFDGFVINGHKFGAGFGAAVLALKEKPAIPVFRGGLQEDERRAGTENLPAILNTADALHMQSEELLSKNKRLSEFQTRMEEEISKRVPVIIVSKDSVRSPNTSYLLFPEQENMDFLFMGLDQRHIVVSTGSSCKSRTRQPSRLLMAMGYSKELAMQAIRISTGLFTTAEEVDLFLKGFLASYEASV
ncbi:MAG: aminotransferase class V-fold PLP-dependent enzyme [Spirochaetia bacterium]|nr:aminotransferase class V-fold PLP-dependent enzyme [Spirochaetia bacterium]